MLKKKSINNQHDSKCRDWKETMMTCESQSVDSKVVEMEKVDSAVDLSMIASLAIEINSEDPVRQLEGATALRKLLSQSVADKVAAVLAAGVAYRLVEFLSRSDNPTLQVLSHLSLSLSSFLVSRLTFSSLLFSSRLLSSRLTTKSMNQRGL